MKRFAALLLTVALTAGSIPMGITAADTESVPENTVVVEQEAPGETPAETAEEEAPPAPEENNTETEEPEGAGASQNTYEAESQETPDVSFTETAEQEETKTAGWYFEEDGWHNYYNATENGQSVVKERAGEWYVPSKKTTIRDGEESLVLTAKTTYYFDEEGALVTNRQVETAAYKKEMNAADRFFNSKGVPVTGYAMYDGSLHYIEKKKGLFKESMVSLSKAGNYTLYNEDGTTKSVKLPAGKRYFDAEGRMVTGEAKTRSNGVQYFNADGVNKTGFISVDGALHHYDANTGKAFDKFVNLSKAQTITDVVTGKSVKLAAGKRYFDADGMPVKGGEFQTKSNGVQFFNADGINKTGYMSNDGALSFFDASTGKAYDKFVNLSKAQTITDAATGKSVKLAAGKRYFDAEGIMVKGEYQTKNNGLQYFTSAGINRTGYISNNGALYFYDASKGRVADTLVSLSKAQTITDVATGKSVKLAAGKRYFGEDGVMVTKETQTKDNGLQYFTAAGINRTGYVSVNGVLYYYDASKGRLTNASMTLKKATTITDAVTGKSVKLAAGTRFFTEDGTVQRGWYPSEEEKSRYYSNEGLAQTGYISVDGKIYYVNGDKGILREASHNLGSSKTIRDQTTGKSVKLDKGTRFFGPDGVMVTGWYPSEEEKSFYYNGSGLRQTGYISVGGKIYYVNSSTGILREASNSLSKDTTIKDQTTGKSIKLSKGTRFFGPDGVMRTGWYPSEEEKNFYYNAAGLQQNGYIYVDGTVYYADSKTGLYKEASHTLSKDTTIKDQVTGKSIKLSKGTRFFGPDGAMRTGWYPSEEEKNFYYGKDGLLQTGHISVNGVIYFVYSRDGALRNASSSLSKDATITDQVTGKSVKLLKGTRYFGDDCAMVTGWYPSETEKSFYYNKDGLKQTGYISVNGELFYIDADKGVLKDEGNTLSKDLTVKDQVTGKSVTLTSGTRYFDAQGNLVHGEYETKDYGTQYFDTYGNAQYGYVYYNDALHYIDRNIGKLKNAVNRDIDGIREIVNQDKPSTYVKLNPGDRYFDENGDAVTGCYRSIDAYSSEGKHYTGLQYFFDDGAMAYRFTRIDGNWKYFLKSGGMVTGGDFDFSYAGGVLSEKAKGAYSFDGGTYFKPGHYYFDENGNMQTGIIAVDGKNYAYSDATGRRVDSGWVLAGGVWYLLNDDGSVAVDENGNMISGTPTAEGFLKDSRDGKTYMVNDDGTLATGWHKIGSKWYHFDETTGVLDKTADALNDQFVSMDGKVYYLNSKGKFVTNWQKIGGKWYYFDEDGVRADDTTVFGITFDENGVAKTGGRSYTSYKNYTHYPVTDEMIDMVKRAQTKLASRNPTLWYCFTDKDHHRAGMFQYKGGKWNLVIYTSVAVGAWVNGRSKTPTTITVITQKNYRMTHLTSFYYVSWTRAGVGYHTPLYNINRTSVTEKTPMVDTRTSGHISNGCMRLGFYNAVWVYNNVPKNTWVQMYGK